MQRYAITTNYIQLRDSNQNKEASMYIDGRSKYSRNIARFIYRHDPRQQINNPIAYLKGMKEIGYSCVQ